MNQKLLRTLVLEIMETKGTPKEKAEKLASQLNHYPGYSWLSVYFFIKCVIEYYEGKANE